MKKNNTQDISFCNNSSSTNEKSDIDICLTNNEVIEEEIGPQMSDSNKSVYKYIPKIRKRSADICYTLNLYEKNGNIFVHHDHESNKIFIAKLRKVNFENENFQELFDKGKNNLGNYFKEDVNNIPDITFWYQRYYYYKKFDEGIKMDYESRIYFFTN